VVHEKLMIPLDLEVPLNPLFSGQEAELNDLSRLTDSPGKLILVTGKVGVGKTTLLKYFENRWQKKFPGGVYWFSGQTKYNVKGKGKLEEEIDDFLMIEDDGHRLVVLDDIENISKPSLIAFTDRILNNGKVSLVILGQPGKLSKLFLGKKTPPQCHTIPLTPPSVSVLAATVKNRIEQINDPSKKELYLKKINDSPGFIKGFLKVAPKKTLVAIDQISNIADNEFAAKNEIPEKKQNDNIRKGTDWAGFFRSPGFITAVIFFIINNYFSFRPASTLGKLLQRAGITVEQTDSLPKTKVTHYTTARLNFRRSPLVEKNNIITTLDKGQEVDLLKVETSWAKVRYHEKTSNTFMMGWVFTKYLSSIESSSPLPLELGNEPSFPRFGATVIPKVSDNLGRGSIVKKFGPAPKPKK
jgi:energy-coupling factor transporter ATP-binding protein EcfA2